MNVTLDQLKQTIGAELQPSSWITVGQEMISNFGHLTMDTQFIHMDRERAAAETPFGGTIAHGFLSLSLASKMAMEVQPRLLGQSMGVNYGFDKIRFLSPVASGKRIRGWFTLSSVTPKGKERVLLSHHFKIEIEGAETPALIGDWLTLIYFEEAIS
ncbi:MaoC family dehydratase [Pseudovibrio sp. SPO723]|uniref:MaoC family dehydratase n=1 Tax=Nesiotobacter zosterae TaxID=392721 RepID=UPI0029C41D8B|nr:MaoC family dehydratase [Pseudovibrio sp. SPO723]MDX5594378.1 MaoC family dehydratase [Pseudovibrio sp. SPO723]